MIGNAGLALLKKISLYRIWSMINNLNYIMNILKCNIFIPP